MNTIKKGDVFSAIPIDQTFEILHVHPDYKAQVLITRNGFKGEHNVNLNTIEVHLLNPDLYIHISHFTLNNQTK